MSDNAEQLLISSMILTGNIFGPEEAGITNGHFHSYQAEYEWILKYRLDYQEAPTRAAFKSVFPDFPMLEATDVDFAIGEVKTSHIAHSVTQTIKEAATKIRQGEPQEALGYLYKRVTDLSKNTDASNRTTNFMDDWGAHFDRVMEVANTPEDQRIKIPYGYPTLDARTNGQLRGSLALFAARLGQGKTWNLVQTGASALMAGNNVRMYSLEMPKWQIEQRFVVVLCHLLGIPGITASAISSGRIDLLEYKQILGMLKERVPGELHINDRGRGKVTPMTIASGLSEQGADLVLIDYITLLGTSSGGRALEGWQTAGQISDELKEVAIRFNVPIFAAAQINRDGDGAHPWKPPRTKNLAQSDNLGQDADVVITMKRSSKGSAVYLLDKNRHGDGGFIWHSRFFANTGDFTEITKDEALTILNEQGELDDD